MKRVFSPVQDLIEEPDDEDLMEEEEPDDFNLANFQAYVGCLSFML